MSTLTKKLWRVIKHTRGQFLAVMAVITIGVLIYVSTNTAFYNLKAAKESFYQEYDFADYYFYVIRAPQGIIKQIELISGVTKATGRIQKDVILMLNDGQRGTARLISYPLPMDREVNRLHLLTGRYFEENPLGAKIEVLIDPHHAEANDLHPNDIMTIIAGGRLVSLSMVGTAISPEFVYIIKNVATLIPNPKTFGIIMIPHAQAQKIFGMTGKINQVVLKLSPDADKEKIAQQVEEILEPYGNLISYPREDQLSHVVLQAELDGLQISAHYLPAIFLAAAAAIQFVMLSRIVKSQRLQIGIMKAIGYGGWQIMRHYASYAMTVALLGALTGTLLGLWLSGIFVQFYAEFFLFPEIIGEVNLRVMLYSFALCIIVGAFAGLIASRSAVSINPAEAMNPEPPKEGRRIVIEHWPWLWQRLSSTWKMSLRNALRNRIRFSVTFLGIVFAVGLLITTFFWFDTMDYMIKTHFYQEQRHDYLIRFVNPLKEPVLLSISRIDGVLMVEPFFELPVRMYFKDNKEETLLLGMHPDVVMRKISDTAGRPLPLPEVGFIINQRTADKLKAEAGDVVTIKTLLGIGPARTAEVKVVDISQQFIGSESFITLQLLNRMLRSQHLVSGAMLWVDPGKAEAVEEKLEEFINISSIASLQDGLDSFYQILDTLIYFIAVMVIFAAVLGFAIVYNASLISFEERKRELSLLRLNGYTNSEVSGLLLKENLMQSVLGVALGLPFGYLMAMGYVRALETELLAFPMVIYPTTYFLSALVGILFIAAAHLLARRRVKHLKLTETLKHKE